MLSVYMDIRSYHNKAFGDQMSHLLRFINASIQMHAYPNMMISVLLDMKEIYVNPVVNTTALGIHVKVLIYAKNAQIIKLIH